MAKKALDKTGYLRVRVVRGAQHLRGQLVAGVGGDREYYVSPKTGFLHLCDIKLVYRHGRGRVRQRTPQADAGVHPDDAARLKFFKEYEVEKRPPPPPPPRKASSPVAPLASDESADTDQPPDSASGESDSSGASVPLSDQLPEDSAEWTADEWVQRAEVMGIDLRASEKRQKKGPLVDTIRKKAAALDAEESDVG